MTAHQFVRNFAKLLSQSGLTYQNIKDGKITIDNVEIDLNTLSLDSSYYSVDIKETVFEPLAHTLNDSSPDAKVIFLGTHPKNQCPDCGSTLQTKWFGLKNTEKCINPNCSNYYDRGFDVLPPINYEKEIEKMRKQQQLSIFPESEEADKAMKNLKQVLDNLDKRDESTKIE